MNTQPYVEFPYDFRVRLDIALYKEDIAILGVTKTHVYTQHSVNFRVRMETPRLEGSTVLKNS